MNFLLVDIWNGVANRIECFNTSGDQFVAFVGAVSLFADFLSLTAFTDKFVIQKMDLVSSACSPDRNVRRPSQSSIKQAPFKKQVFDEIRCKDGLRILDIFPETLRKRIVQKSTFRKKTATYFIEKLSQEIFRRNQLPFPRKTLGHFANFCHFDSFLIEHSAPDPYSLH